MRGLTMKVAMGAGIGAITVLVAGWASGSGTTPVAAQATLLHASAVTAEASYASDIQPFFDNRCVSCHGGVDDDGQKRLEAALNLTSYETLMAGSEFGSVVEPGDAEGSILLEMLLDGSMPEEGDPATPEEIEMITNWITEGAENN